MTAHDVIAKLVHAGFVCHEGSRHTKLAGPDGRVTVIHRHKGDIPLGTLRAISKQTGVVLP